MVVCPCCNEYLTLNETFQVCRRGLFINNHGPYRLIPQELLNKYVEAQKVYATCLKEMADIIHAARKEVLDDVQSNPEKPMQLGPEHQLMTTIVPKPVTLVPQVVKEDKVPEGMYT